MRAKLVGKCFINTRSLSQNSALTTLLEAQGANVFSFPLLEIVPTKEWRAIDKLIIGAATGSPIFLTSANAVDIFAKRVSKISPDALKKFDCFVVGEKTKQVANELGLRVVFTPTIASADGLAREFIDACKGGLVTNASEALSLIRGDIANDVLARLLKEARFDVTELVAYHSKVPKVSREKLEEFILLLGCDIPGQQEIQSNPASAIILTSSQAVRNAFEVLDSQDLIEPEIAKQSLRQIPSFSIGEPTARTAEQYGLNLVAVAREQTIESLVLELVSYFAS